MDRTPKRPHRPTGRKPPGGDRAGSGRPKGSTNSLDYGQVKALAAMKLRVPEGASPEVEALANRTLERLIEVMEEKVSPLAASGVTKAVTRIREELLGPLAQKHELTGKDGEALNVSVNIIRKVVAPADLTALGATAENPEDTEDTDPGGGAA